MAERLRRIAQQPMLFGELLNARGFDSLREARMVIEEWRRDFTASRTHSTHGELTPTEFVPTAAHRSPAGHR